MNIVFNSESINDFKAIKNNSIITNIGNNFFSQEAVNSVLAKIEQIDLTPHGYKLNKEYGWSMDKINHTIPLYQKWLAMQVIYEDLSFAPSSLIDEFWHAHILDTKKYYKDCMEICGHMIHHYPYFGLTDHETEKDLEAGFELTKKLFEYHFGINSLGYNSKEAASCGCRSGNGSSCR